MISRSGRSETTVVDVVARSVLEAGGDVAFGVVGSGNFTVTAALRRSGARFVAARHESGAVAWPMPRAGDRRLGVCTVHQGPGLTNAMTGLAEAAKSRTPLLVLARRHARRRGAARTSASTRRRWPTPWAPSPERVHGPATAAPTSCARAAGGPASSGAPWC